MPQALPSTLPTWFWAVLPLCHPDFGLCYLSTAVSPLQLAESSPLGFPGVFYSIPPLLFIPESFSELIPLSEEAAGEWWFPKRKGCTWCDTQPNSLTMCKNKITPHKAALQALPQMRQMEEAQHANQALFLLKKTPNLPSC